MECFRIDESGYTGFELLNSEQRYQGATAIAISDDEATQLIRHHFPRLKASELKYKQLASRPTYRQAILELKRAVLSQHKSVTYICDKRFVLLLMFLDHAVEPFYYERGLDFYENGQNIVLASVLNSVGPTLFGQEKFDALLTAFQFAVKKKTREALSALVLAAKRLDWSKFPLVLGPLVHGSPECLAAISTPSLTTDATLVVLMSLITRMEILADGPYRVEHDQSKNLLAYNTLLQSIIDHPNIIAFTGSENAKIAFPLKLSSVSQVDSLASPAIQIADVMIGSVIDSKNVLAGLRSPRLDPEAVLSLYSEEQLIHLVPSRDLEREIDSRKNTRPSELINYFAENFGPALRTIKVGS